jgi:hypothetical protein
MRKDGTAADSGGTRAWLPFLWIILASAAAHLWCLGSQFYMDDFPQIRDNEILKTGEILQTKLLAWTHLWYFIQYRLFGFSAVGFHAVNWLLHTAVACVLFGFGRDFIRGKGPEGVALFGALLFAVHPLGSEIPNYARTQDLAWVTLFSLLAAWAMLRYLREGGWELVHGVDGEIPVFQRTHRWWKLVLCALAVAGAAFSKGPGLFHAAMEVGMVALAFFPREWGRQWRKITAIVAGGGVLVLAVAWMLGMLDFGMAAVNQWNEPRFIGHAWTVARVFWEFAWRAVLPVTLSSDHHIAETLKPEATDYLSAIGMLVLVGLGVILACREKHRLLGVCLALFVGTILFRVLYLIPEFMPEYRIYPGLPWFCLGAAIVLAAVWKWMFAHVSPKAAAVVLLAGFAFLSARRSFLWHDLETLMADVLKQYPSQGRAVWELQDRDTDAGNWQSVIDRQERVWPEVRRRFITELGKLQPDRELPTGHFSLAEVACMGRHARAVAHVKSPAEGLALINQLEAYMLAMRIDPATNPNHWSHFARDKALVLELAGDLTAALKVLEREDGEPPLWPKDYGRIRKKQAAGQP